LSDLCDSEKCAAIQFREFTNGHAGQVIVELRVGGNGKAAATVVPPSMHETGETVEWERYGEPALVAGGDLKRAVIQLAVACVLMPRYPGQGSRHEGALVLGGVLARAGWNADDIGHVVEVIAQAAGDDDVRDRVSTAISAISVKANGRDVPGLTRLGELWGKDAADTLAKWLPWRELLADKGAGLEDMVALAFAEEQADYFRYVAASSQWMRWDGSRWQVEGTLAAFDVSRKLCREAGDARAKTVSAVTTLARADRRMAAAMDQWDSDPEIFNTPTKESS